MSKAIISQLVKLRDGTHCIQVLKLHEEESMGYLTSEGAVPCRICLFSQSAIISPGSSY